MGGPLDRLSDAITGVGGAIQAPFGLAWDLARSPFVDDDTDGIFGTLNATVTSRTGQFFSSLLGPDEGLGQVIGALPSSVRSVGRGPVQGILGGLETAYREGVGEPLSMALTAGSLTQSKTYLESQGRSTSVMDQFGALFDADTWREADKISEHRSPGQAMVIAFGTKDILDQEELERFQGTDIYVFVSGTLDAVLRTYYSPDIIAGKSATAYRAGRLGALGETARLGTITERAAPQIGRRAERLGLMAERSSLPGAGRVTRGLDRLQNSLTTINNGLDAVYERMPRSLQNFVGEQHYGPEDISRLERLEGTRRQVTTEELMARRAASVDPTEINVLKRILESRAIREARMAAGAADPVPGFRSRIQAQVTADIDSYFSRPMPKGVASRLLEGTPAWKRFDSFIESLPTDIDTRAGLIHDRLFPNHPQGDILSRFLAESVGPAEREAVLRVGMGDMRAIKALEASNYSLARRLEDLMVDRATILADPIFQPKMGVKLTSDMVGRADPTGINPFFDDYRNAVERLQRIGEEVGGIADESALNKRLLGAQRSLPGGPTYTRGDQLRNAIKSSSFYQDSIWGKGVRLITDMRPHHMVSTEDPAASGHLQRMLREAGYDDDLIARARGQFDAIDPAARGPAFDRWIDRAQKRILEDHGLDEDEIQAVLESSHIGRRQAESYIKQSKYDAQGRARIRYHDGTEIIDQELPLSATQLRNVTTVPNFRLLEKHAARYARLKYGDDFRSMITRGAKPAWTAKEYGLDALRGIMQVWKPTVLLRPAWTLRVIGDEQMRMIAKFGALSWGLGLRDSINDYMAMLRHDSPVFNRVLRSDNFTRLARRTAFTAAGAGVAGPLGAVAANSLGNRLVTKMAAAEEAGILNLRFGGHSISGPFGDAGSVEEFFKVHNSARGAVDQLFGRHENSFYRSMKRDPSRYRTYTWGESEATNGIYRAEWAKNLRHQISQDAMGKQFLAGKTVDDVVEWLDNTLEGRQYSSLLPWRRDKRAWAEAYADQINAYTGGVAEVKSKILKLGDNPSEGEVAKILDLIPEDARAPIHGAETELMQAKNPINQLIGQFVDNAFEILGTLATDSMSRNPTFSRFYQAEARRLFSTLAPGATSEATIHMLENQARNFALRETRELLYDLAEESQFGSMVRLVMPFYGPWQEVLTRWAGLAKENPVFAMRANQVAQVPDRLGWTYKDDRGNNFLRIRIPKWAKGLLNQGAFHSALDSQGYIFLDKSGFNLVAQGTPGFGPFIQMAVSDMVKNNPDLESSVKFILPFGPVKGPLDALTPPTIKRAFAVSSEDEGAARANAQARILQTRLTRMENGELERVDFSDPAARRDFLKDIEDETTAFMNLRFFTGYVAPVSPLYESPYKPYIDIYRSLRDGDYKRARQIGEEFDIPDASRLPTAVDPGDRSITADDIFLETFGEEYFALTQAFSESVNGIPPTLEGLETSEKYNTLITRYPEWGGVIAGYDGGTASQFSRAVYDRQMGNGERRRLSTDEILDGPDIRLGWSKYSKYMDLLEAFRVQRGLPNFQVKAAQDLSNLKRIIITQLAAEHPAWYREFAVTDRTTWGNRIDGARALTQDDDLMGRPDIQGMADYLHMRDVMMSALAARESHSLTAASNQDLANLWTTMVHNLVERNPEFGEIWYRKLENDPLDQEAGTISPIEPSRSGGRVGSGAGL